ncbi:histidine phosphatase family protein [Nocardia fusca]|uniref:histidine phosphatase family protein n=1 Tax=Nocardia fusca TaxID=941183 RepID=UPI0012F4CE1A|nr:histidine phosphatase family protein [Nocardia fusca]
MRFSIVLVRHAQSVPPTPAGPGDYQRPLTEPGKAQVIGLTDQLADIRPSAIVSSPYLRAVQTLEPAARLLGLPICIDERLREWDSGIAPAPDYERHYEESWARPQRARPGAESLNELTERAVGALIDLTDSAGQPVLVGSHGTFISRALLGLGCSGINWDFHRAMPMPAVYRLDCGDSGIHAVGPGL